MKNLLAKLFKKSNHNKATTTATATVKRQWRSTSAYNANEMLVLKYDYMKMGYTVDVKFYNSPTFGKLWVIKYAK